MIGPGRMSSPLAPLCLPPFTIHSQRVLSKKRGSGRRVGCDFCLAKEMMAQVAIASFHWGWAVISDLRSYLFVLVTEAAVRIW